ncbi:uncharacterized protein [Nicotiana sylvestris]|uniref:Uncharacterized protein LOC104233840 n=1 Tax=Nicotiana sylvestris TaxID=4096 RepID=A0A1U7XF69_NICSY|nr:PREDICTED: uncharacterized protein LOC104233840 [Nicotiana sylvestris]
MVNALVNRAATVNQATTYLRNLSTATPTNNPPTTSSADGPKKPKREKKNLFEVAQFLPNWGISYHMSKTHWTSVSYEITKINLYKDGRHEVTKTVFRSSLPIADAHKKMSGVHKRCWKYIANFKKAEGSLDQIKKAEENTPNSDVEAA